MKRNILLTLFAFATAFFLSSCTEFLKETPVDQISVDYIYSTGDGLEVGVNALYSLMRTYNIPAFEGTPLAANVFFMVADDLGQTRTWHRPYGPNNHTPTGYPAYKWTEGYKIIDRCNAIIAGSENITDYNETLKNRIVAQARVIRAEIYFDLIRMYDNILIDVTPTTPENINDSITYSVANPADVYALINGDLNFAIENLSYDEPYGRYSKSVARHLRGKSAMWQSDWAEAITQFDAIINESGKALVPIDQVFGQNLNHKEMLFAYTRNELLGGNDALAGGGGTWISSVFVQRLYENSSGDFIQDPEYGGQALAWSTCNEYLRSLYDKVNDKRYTTYYYPELYTANNPASPRFGQVIPLSGYDDNLRRYCFSLKKFHDVTKGALTNDSWKDYPIIPRQI